MCLNNKANAVKKFLTDHAGRKYIFAYKRVCVEHTTRYDAYGWGCRGNPTGRLMAPFRNSFQYKPGWNYSNSQAKGPCKKTQEINRGIHVYSSKKAYMTENEEKKYLKVRCYLSDFIGYDGINEMAFKKIYIPQSEYKRAGGKV